MWNYDPTADSDDTEDEENEENQGSDTEGKTIRMKTMVSATTDMAM